MVQEVEASRSLSLEELPPILILHLKRFVKDNDLEWSVDVENIPYGQSSAKLPVIQDIQVIRVI